MRTLIALLGSLALLLATLLGFAPAISLAKPTKRGGGSATVTAGGGPLRVQVDKSKVDLKEHRLELRMSRPAGKVHIKVQGESGAVLAEDIQDFSGRGAGTPLIVTWSPSSDEAVGRIELRAYDAAGYYVGVALSPWFVAIPHDDVSFRTDSADIDEAEKPKLEAAFGKVTEILAKDKDKEHRRITLFIAGHTDSVGNDAYNLKLSQARARSIAAWFRRRGIRIPIAYEGFGETSPAVKTADGVDEPRNRRVDYILSDEDPPLKTTGFRASWKRVS